MRKINKNETYLEYYNKEKENTDIKIIVYIINSEYMSNYDNQSKEIKKQIIDFVNAIKKENKNIVFSLKDLPIFKTYDIIINKQIENMYKTINRELSPSALTESQKLANEIFDLKIDFAYSITIDNESYMYYGSSKEFLEKNIKILLHNRNGVIIFYMNINDNNTSFGFEINKDSIDEIDVKTLKKYSTESNILFTTFNKIKECIRPNA